MDPYKYDPNKVIQAAEAKRAVNDVNGAHMVFESALLEWGDDAREGASDPDQMREAIATLWLSYADFYRGANQFKSAMDTFEKAVNDPFVAPLGRVWLEYARFAEERNKLVTAQNVFLRALVGNGSPPAVTDEQDTSILWAEFLQMMRKSKDPTLTMQALKEGVQAEHVVRNAQPDGLVQSTGASTSTDVAEPDPKRMRTESPETGILKTHVVTPEAVQAEKDGLLSVTDEMPPEVAAAWMARDGDAPPSPPEPPLFSPSTPKLSDPTGRDLLGDDLALAVIERLLMADGDILLNACRGMWMISLLKEKEAAKSIQNFDKEIATDLEKMETSLENRLSLAGSATSAIEMVNANERQQFEASCAQRRQQMLTLIAWDFRTVLYVQQTLLTSLKIPGFDGPNSDASALDLQSRVCSLLHSAWYVRAKMGEKAHKTMLVKQAERLKREKSNRSPIPTRTPPRSPVPSGMGGMPPSSHHNLPPMQQQLPPPSYQQQMPPPVYANAAPMYPQPPPQESYSMHQQQQPQMQQPHGFFPQQQNLGFMQQVPMPPLQQQQQPPPPPPPPGNYGRQPPYY